MSIGRTGVASVCLAIVAYTAAQWLTHDFQVWTAEGSRRLVIALKPVPAPAVQVHGPGLQVQTLAALLSGSGTPTIVDFIYTRCVSVCVALGGVFQQMQDRIVEARGSGGRLPVQLLSISFDASHDDAGALADYAGGQRADAHLWRFARAADAADNQALLDRYQVTVIPDGLGGYEHNAALLVVDAAGRLVRVFDYAQAEMALAFARALPAAGAAP